MTNLVNILKYCPKGTKLYSPIYGEVVLDSVQSKSIYTLAKTNNGATLVVEFNHLGRLYYEFSNSECVLFPSKDQRDWDKFRIPAKKGDIMMFDDKSAVFMIDAMTDNYVTIIAYVDKYSNFRTEGQILLNYIPASEDMKKKFFDAMELVAVYGMGWGHLFYPESVGKDVNMLVSRAGCEWHCYMNTARSWYFHVRPAIVWALTGNDSHHICRNTHYNINQASLELTTGVTWHFRNSRHTFHFIKARLYDQSETDALNAKINDMRNLMQRKDREIGDKENTRNDIQNLKKDV